MRFQQRSDTWFSQTNWIPWKSCHVPTAQHQDVALSKQSQAPFSNQLVFSLLPPHFSNAFPKGYLTFMGFFLQVWRRSLLKVTHFSAISLDIHFSCNSGCKSHRVSYCSSRQMYRNMNSGNHSNSYRHFPTSFFPFGLEKASGLSHCKNEQENSLWSLTPITRWSHLFILLRNESQAELLKTCNMAKN